MSTNMQDYIARSNRQEWKPLSEAGIDTRGLYVKSLRNDESAARPLTFLLKFEAGSSYPYHNHPSGEELFVLEGSVWLNNEELVAGDYLYTPPNFKHSVKSERGCILLLIVPEEVEILG